MSRFLVFMWAYTCAGFEIARWLAWQACQDKDWLERIFGSRKAGARLE